MSQKEEVLELIGAAWLNLHFANYQAKVARQEFLDALLNGEDLGITQEEMSAECVNQVDHISRSRIAQYIGEARKQSYNEE